MSQSNSNESWYGSTSTGGRRSRADGASGGQFRVRSMSTGGDGDVAGYCSAASAPRLTVTTSFQGPDEIVTSYEHIGNRMTSHFGFGGGLNNGGGFNFRVMGYKETSLCAPDYVSFDLKAETDRLMNRTEQLFSTGGLKTASEVSRSHMDDHELVI